MDTALPLTFAEYFAGIGLMRMGLEPLGWRVMFANDISEKKRAMYEAFFPRSTHYTVSDVFGLHADAVPVTTLATCSFPCIDLSLAGNMNGIDGSHSSAFWGFVRILKSQGQNAPAMILVENVLGWLSSNDGADFRVTVQALNKLGYSCDVFVLNALRFTPQSRSRVFLLGAKLSGEPLDLTLMLKRPKSLAPERLKRTLLQNQDLKWRYTPIPPPPPPRDYGLGEIVEKVPSSSDLWWSHAEIDRHLAMMSSLHRKRVAELEAGDATVYRTFFRRIRNGQQMAEVRDDEVAGCLRTAVGGSGKQFLIEAGRGELRMRALTPREYARLQGVPDCFRIGVNGVQALTGFGDAVCVPVITWIAENVVRVAWERLQRARHAGQSQT
jgi:DNA (cytosine-5)-methyltransferase 1